ncbi:MAG: M20/M25/M40 family metallo-hydrolase [Oscillospiraceae bacterium]|jgi:tripeptide aminopeptidase|nr:M20/M25/M40 family metallo-hydrolase [Oscillospiraceae bacterium]
MSADRLYNTFSQLVSIDNPSLGEREVCDWLKAELLSLGFSTFEDDTAQKIGGNSGNLYGFLPGDDGLEPVLLCAHMDAVEPSRNKECVLHGDGTITSKGDTVLAADDLSGIAEILEAVRRLTESGAAHRPIEVLFCAAEELYGRGALHFDTSILKSKEAFVFDLSGEVGRAAIKAPSIITFEAVFTGKAAHAGFAFDDGIHAVAAACEAVLALPMGQTDSDTTCNVGSIRGGGATNIIPDICSITGEIRSFSHDRARYWAEEIKGRVLQTAQNRGAECGFAFTEHIKAYETPEDSPAAARFRKACAALDLPCKLEKTFGGSDNNHLVNAGIDGIVVASAMYDCHSTREHTRLQGMETVAELIVRLVTPQ